MAALKLPRRRGRLPLAARAAPPNPRRPMSFFLPDEALNALLITAAIVGMASVVEAKDLPTRHVLTLEAARHVIKTAEQLAEQKGWPCVLAVVDSGGYLIFLERMDASPMVASVELAPQKARTAVLFGKPTKALEDAIHGGRMAATTAGFVEMAGGQPLLVDGEVVGAIGVSSAQPDWDVTLANAGAQALADQSRSERPKPGIE
jgi:glc operon protein GlcG